MRERLDLAEESGQIDGLRVVVVAPGLEGLLPVPGHGVGRQSDHRDRVASSALAGGWPPNRRGRAGSCPSESGRALRSSPSRRPGRRPRPSAPRSLPPAPRQHVAVHLVVFDEKDSGHRPLRRCANRSMGGVSIGDSRRNV